MTVSDARKPWAKGTASIRLRGGAGQRQRRRRLAAEPMCRHCIAKGIVTASTVPDHIVSLAKGGTDDDSNIQCLCEPCHQAKTFKERGFRPRVAIAEDGWPQD